MKRTNDEWLLLFEQRTASGLPVRKWCEQHAISYDTYKYWEHKLLLSNKDQELSKPLTFVELPHSVCSSSSSNSPYPFRIHYQAVMIEIAPCADFSQLAGILKALQSGC